MEGEGLIILKKDQPLLHILYIDPFPLLPCLSCRRRKAELGTAAAPFRDSGDIHKLDRARRAEPAKKE